MTTGVPVITRFWGVRGTLAVPGRYTVRYGGNTNCVTLEWGEGHFFIFDAGTGIKVLSDWLVKHGRFPFSAKIFVSHPHYDHINGLPFFSPLYMKENSFEFFGGEHGGQNIDMLISGQMDTVYFPVTISEFSASLSFRTLKQEETFSVGNCQVSTLFLNHPGGCLGYRVQCGKKIFCYVTDNELVSKHSRHYSQEQSDRLAAFLKKADLAVMDATYTAEEYPAKIGWGHSSLTHAVEMADHAGVRQLCLYHHDPGQTDADIDQKLKSARIILKAAGSHTKCIAAREGSKIIL